MKPAYVYRAEVLSVHDGDTMTVRLDLGFRAALTIQVRVKNLNCPELSEPGGIMARDFVRALLPAGAPVVLESFRDRRSFERWVCDVWDADGNLVRNDVITAGHGVQADDQGRSLS